MITDWTKYAPYFTKKEFDCKETGENNMDPEFMDVLLAIRKEYDRPMRITSGFRSVKHSIERVKKILGEHPQGRCSDVSVTTSRDRFDLIKIALKHGITRIGYADNFLHLGLGAPNLPPNVFWDYTK